MPSTTMITRNRRRGELPRRRTRRLGRVLLALLVISMLPAGFSLWQAGRLYDRAVRDLPEVERIEDFFGAGEESVFTPSRLLDRTGQKVIRELMHPLASQRRWLQIEPGTDFALPQSIVEATVAFHEPDFWAGQPSSEGEEFLAIILQEMWGRALSHPRLGIGQQLAENLLVPMGGNESAAVHYLQVSFLASKLLNTYSKSQILEWYLNSAYYGNLAYGIDAAALVYFGKHASELTLAESAMLAPIPADPGLNPIDDFEGARLRQAKTLLSMVETGRIGEAQAEEAIRQDLNLRPREEIRHGLEASAFERYVWNQLQERYGPAFMRRGGLKVVTTLDDDLQSQVACMADAYLQRLKAGVSAGSAAGLSGQACEGASLLLPMRPSDSTMDHNLTDAAAVVLEPATGQILSLVDSLIETAWTGRSGVMAEMPREGGTLLMPFIYLTAFAHGYSPGSMVLDLPDQMPTGELASQGASEGHGTGYMGPTSMRMALVNSYSAAARRTLNLVGLNDTLQTAHQMGIRTLADPSIDYEAAILQGRGEATLLDLAYSYGVVANRGKMAGEAIPEGSREQGFRILDPIAILRIEGPGGQGIFECAPEERHVLSSQLAYIMAEVLSDEVARETATDSPEILDIGRPAAIKLGSNEEAKDDWVVGFTPSRVIGIWAGNLEGQQLKEMSARTGAASLWHAVGSYATKDLPTEAWEVPAGISQIEVCFPSGLLPTEYCPKLVSEVFLQGTEPTSYDDLYQPFLIDKETGNLATLFTPIDLVEEKVYMIPPPEAADWARWAGMELPPQTYDAVDERQEPDPEVNILYPPPFAYLRGQVRVRGEATAEGFEYYRLQYGPGLNPTRWVQIGQDKHLRVVGGQLGIWDTEDLNGLYTIQLVVVLEGGLVKTAMVPVTVDNLPPAISLVTPTAGQRFSREKDREGVIQVEASDETALAQVEFFVDGRRIGVTRGEPFSFRWPLEHEGESIIYVRAFDQAGNLSESERIDIFIDP